MKEIEVKILNIDKEDLVSKLIELGAARTLEPVLVSEMYFTYPGDNPINKNFSSLRLRSVGDKHEFTIKNKNKDNSNFNSRDEIETHVEDFESMLGILQQLGFTILRKREKVREEYRCGKVKIEIDTYPQMKPYVELEAQDEDALSEFLKSLGYDLSMTNNGTVTDILKSANLNPDDLMFTEDDKKKLLPSLA